jgi:hypothetical protein
MEERRGSADGYQAKIGGHVTNFNAQFASPACRCCTLLNRKLLLQKHGKLWSGIADSIDNEAAWAAANLAQLEAVCPAKAARAAMNVHWSAAPRRAPGALD